MQSFTIMTVIHTNREIQPERPTPVEFQHTISNVDLKLKWISQKSINCIANQQWESCEKWEISRIDENIVEQEDAHHPRGKGKPETKT